MQFSTLYFLKYGLAFFYDLEPHSLVSLTHGQPYYKGQLTETTCHFIQDTTNLLFQTRLHTYQ
jgi:hypothetical protein